MLGVDIDDVVVIHGDTAVVQYGIGTFGSRATAVGGTAIVNAIEQLIDKAKAIAASLLEVDTEKISFEDGIFRAEGVDQSTSLADVAMEAYVAKKIRPGMEPGLSATNFFEPENFTFPFGTHVCSVEVDRETGEIQINRFLAVDDCGKVINPLLVEGQIHGGIVQALGQALLEEAVYDESGQLITGTLMDYAIPKAHQLPWLETARTETPSPVNPLGIKGVGEAGTIGATPAIVNAVVDALSPLGIHHIDMPLTPMKIWSLIQGKEAS
jgi:carbon-monoxide dehydrogenase large subunit